MMFGSKKNSELERFAEIFEAAMVSLFLQRGEIKFSGVRKARKKIMEYQGRMTADGSDKFVNQGASAMTTTKTYVSAVNFYANKKDLEKKKTLGALIIYIEQSFLAKLMQLLKYPVVDDESDDAMLDSAGTLCNIIAGRFKSEVAKAGYVELEMSHFMNHQNKAFDGVSFCENEFDYFELQFDINDKKRLTVDMTMGTIPKVG